MVEGLKQNVVVEAPLLQTDNVALGRVIARDTIVALPLVNRNYTQILGLTAGTNTGCGGCDAAREPAVRRFAPTARAAATTTSC